MPSSPASRNGPSNQILISVKDFLSPYCNRPTAPPFRLRPTGTAATNIETQQLGYGPGIERTDLNPWLQNSRCREQ
jgi:hypothetical protein